KRSPCCPIELYFSLCQYSPMPFSALFKAADLAILTASPERFLKKTGNQLLTQPIKGSIRRGDNDEEDKFLQEGLANSEKEKSENLMIVDLMRNDLSRVSQVGEVQVAELFGIYSFQQITQMVSTVSCTLKPGLTFEDIIARTFPMGSMTGVPKIKCMELIDHYEKFKRSWFSGTLGYIQPNGDFDFCVIIRSLIVDCSRKEFYFGVGSAITFDANAKDEYQECLLKADGIIKALKN
ncbi:MAG: anthranilate synthase component I family protein, partial [Cyclobacteriaceae bacterium]